MQEMTFGTSSDSDTVYRQHWDSGSETDVFWNVRFRTYQTYHRLRLGKYA